MNVIRVHVDSGEGREWRVKRRNKTEETADISDIVSPFSWLFFFSYYLTKMEEEGTEVLE